MLEIQFIPQMIFSAAGMPDDLCRSMLEIVRAPVFGAAVGNAVSVPVIERILGKLLPLANLVEGPVADFWNDLMPLPTTNVRSLGFGISRGPC